VDALPDLRIEGEVTFIGLVPDFQSGVVVYTTRIGFTTPPQAGLKVGMSASAEIIIAARKGILLVPDRAIGQNSQGRTVVMVMNGDETREREIVTGVSDGVQTEVVSGLEEGETVVVERASQPGPGLF
jgi:multidrug efflux pump subunit AcrA (membrane-fusion protein)